LEEFSHLGPPEMKGLGTCQSFGQSLRGEDTSYDKTDQLKMPDEFYCDNQPVLPKIA